MRAWKGKQQGKGVGRQLQNSGRRRAGRKGKGRRARAKGGGGEAGWEVLQKNRTTGLK